MRTRFPQNNSSTPKSTTVPKVGWLVVLISTFGIIAGLSSWSNNTPSEGLSQIPEEESQPDPEKKDTPENIYNKAKDSTVTIFNEPRSVQGSGALISDTQALTNAHVVEGAETVTVKTINGNSVSARVVKVDTVNDLAVVQMESLVSLPCLPFSTNSLIIGQSVYALGSPLGKEQTFTAGIISKVNDRDIYHTATIAPGASGSPLLDENGYLLGINKAIFKEFRGMSIASSLDAILALNLEASCPQKR